MFRFSLEILSETFLIVRRTERDTIINVHRSSCEGSVILVRFLMKLEFSRQIFEKSSNIKFHKYPSSGSRVVPCGRTDIHTYIQTDMPKLIVAFRNLGNAPQKGLEVFPLGS